MVATRWFAYRNYDRRCRYLARQYNSGNLENVALDTYRRSNLWRMLMVAESNVHTLDTTAAIAISNFLREYLITRYRTRPKSVTKVIPIKVEWRSRDMRLVGLRKILEHDAVKQIYPGDWPEIVISKKLPRTIASRLFNFSHVARDLQTRDTNNCPCRNLFPRKFRKLRGCVYTGDLSLVCCTKLRPILAYGTNFRTKVLQPRVVDAIEKALDSFVSMQSTAESIDPHLYQPWKTEVLRTVRTKLPHTPSNHGVTWCRRSRKYLHFLHKYLVIVPTDKASNNASFICRNLYVDIIKKELCSSGAYSVYNRTLEQIIRTHQRFLKPKGFFNSKNMGPIYALPKMHKSTPKCRFIAALFKCLTTKCSVVVTVFLNQILNTLRDRDDAHIRLTGIRRMFVVNGYEEVAEFFQRPGRPVGSSTQVFIQETSPQCIRPSLIKIS